MNREIERKFLVRNDAWRTEADDGVECRQGYLCTDAAKTVRVRQMGTRGFLTVKGRTEGCSRDEFEYEIPITDAQALFALCDAIVEKRRYLISYEGMSWELDVFEGDNIGLMVAEIELESEDQPFINPAWLGDEVTGDPRYYNAVLAQNPFSTWTI